VLIPFFREAERSLYPKHVVIERTSDKGWTEDSWKCLRKPGCRKVFQTRGNSGLGLENPDT